MEWIIVVLAAAIAALVVVVFWQRTAMKRNLQKMKEVDQVLTQYVAEHVDLQKKLDEVRQDYERQKDMADEILRVREQSRALKHDMKNHTLVMLSYLEENKVEEARQYASDILDKLNRMYTYVNVGNSLLSYIINHKLSAAKEQGMEVKAEIENLPFGYMDSMDFSSLLNNILDNAIEGGAASQRRVLMVSIHNQRGFDVITVKNSIPKSVLQHNPDLVTTKSAPGHGMGMKQIRKIVEKYEGTLDVQEDGDLFSVSVLFAS